MTEKTIIRSPHGEARREVELGSIKVPDLWHLAEQFREIARVAGIIFDMTKEHHATWSDETRLDQEVKVELTLQQAVDAEQMVLDCWHLCHDLLAHIKVEAAIAAVKALYIKKETEDEVTQRQNCSQQLP